MCEQCSAATKTYGEVLPHWWLVQATKDGSMMKAGDFGLVWMNNPDFYWPDTLAPRKDPAFEFTEAQFDNMSEETGVEWDDYMDYVEKMTPYFRCDPGTGHNLVMACDDAGYDSKKHGRHLLAWLCHRMAVVVERNPVADDIVSDKYAVEDEKSWGFVRDNVGNTTKNTGEKHVQQ